MNLVVIVPDGMTDLPVKELDNKTPLQTANTRYIDFMLRNGITGIVSTIPANIEPGSDVANLSILGINPKRIKIGRGALEALAKNINIKKNENVFRANFVCIKNNILVDYTGGNIKTSQAKKLINFLNKNFDSNIRFVSGVDYRNIAIIKNNKINIKTTPPHNIINKKIDKFLPQGKSAALIREIMFKTYDILSTHPLNKNKKNPANMMWLWGEGGLDGKIDSFYEKYKLKGAIISAVDIIRGIGRLLKMDIINVPGITGDFRTNYKNKAIYTLKNLKKYDVIYVHIEAPDEAGHHGNWKEKVRAIERIDKQVVKPLLDSKEKFNILLLPDHPTPIIKRTHINSPVPFILYSKNNTLLPNHKFIKFNEYILNNPPVIIKKGYTLLNWVLRYLDERN